MNRAHWAVAILWVLLMLSVLTAPQPPDELADVIGAGLGGFAVLYLLIVYAPAKVRGWRAARADG